MDLGARGTCRLCTLTEHAKAEQEWVSRYAEAMCCSSEGSCHLADCELLVTPQVYWSGNHYLDKEVTRLAQAGLMKISSSAPLEETSEAIDLLLLRLISFCGGPGAHIILALCLGS